MAIQVGQGCNFLSATEIAGAYLKHQSRPLMTAIQLLRFVDPWQPVWEATGGPHGPLTALYLASDEADRIGFVGDHIERWHPDVRDHKWAQLAEAERHFFEAVAIACRAILAFDEVTNRIKDSN